MAKHQLIIVGSGPAGLTAAIYAARANLAPVLLAGEIFGGQLMNTSVVENFPGFPEGILGPELINRMMEQAKKYGTEIIYKSATKVDFTGESKKVFAGDNMYEADAVILAMGAYPRKLGLDGEQKFWGKGVSSCATCDGALYKGKVVAVVGGGDSAMEEALFLSKFATKVYLIHRRDEFRASDVMRERVLAHEKIEILYNTEVHEVNGEATVKSLTLFNNVTNETTDLPLDGLFLAIGHVPDSVLTKDQLDQDEKGYIKVTDHTKTSIPGVFVAGDVHDHEYKQAITAAGMGCMAALDVEKWLELNDKA
ncbi:MAG: thioredoxin-disulfide reductase [Candidatus Dojkabacteria bacterium]